MKITRRKITAATTTSKLASDKMLEAFETRLEELKVDSSTKVTASYDIDEEGHKEIVNWLKDHEQAYNDALRYFETDDLMNVNPDEIEGWISEHDQLTEDYCNYFGLDPDDFIYGSCSNVEASEQYDKDNKAVEVLNTDADYIYKDVEGGFGEKDAEYTLEEIKQYWNNNHDSDPVLAEYDSYDSWWNDTLNNFLIEI